MRIALKHVFYYLNKYFLHSLSLDMIAAYAVIDEDCGHYFDPLLPALTAKHVQEYNGDESVK